MTKTGAYALLALVAATQLTACAPDACTIDGITYTEAQCAAIEASLASNGEDIPSDPSSVSNVFVDEAGIFDLDDPFIDLSLTEEARYEYKLGERIDLTTWDTMVSQSGFVGYGALGGMEDYDPEHMVSFITELFAVSNDGDEIPEAYYDVLPFAEDDDEPYIGNTLNRGNADCWDPTNPYYGLEGCWAMFADECGRPFTAWDAEEANRGECNISVIARDGYLEQGPTVSTF